MAPSATATSPQEGTNGTFDVRTDMEGQNGTHEQDPATASPRTTKLYTDAYTHGYTEGYIKSAESPRPMPIAIVGMACRLPGNVSTPDEFWELCSRARSGWSEIPKERFEAASFYHPSAGKSGCFNAQGGNFLKEDVGLFDAPFFSLTAQESTSMDPQQRILLECTFEALDSAGIPKHEIVGKDVGVFVGGSFSEYEAQSFMDSDTIPMYQATGCAFAMQSNRISHFFDLRGPSFTMDTACSSSLVAMHQACQSLRNKESKTAIVGGCHLNMLPEFWVSMAKSRLFSSEGRSFSFDSRGTGYGRGEGCGIVILKALDQAIKDNDIIRSVIVASGINQDGKTPGITMPNGDAQESLMRSVYKNAEIDPKDTGYVEAHGTGTKVGDPIEAAALHKIFGEGRSARNPLFVGSVKSNIGHLEAASGIISVIKTALMLERGFILPNYDFKKGNEDIPFAKWHMKIPISQRPFPKLKRASVNNFGFGGTNAHLVMERAPLTRSNEEQSESGVSSRKLFVLSANNKSALELQMKNLGIYLEQRPEIFQNDLMTNLAYTLGQRRSLMQWRVAIPSSSSFDLIQSLNSGKVAPVREGEAASRIGFIFTGQGAQYHNMGHELYHQYPVYAATLDACDKYLTSLNAPFSLLDELNKDAETSLVNEAHISQPSCTAVQLALTDLLRSWGITPVAVAGHSSGEIGAAYAAGILPLQSCMAIAYHRGMATRALKKNYPDLKGAMLAVGGTKEEIEPMLSQLSAKARIACFNSPTSLTISGDEPAINELHKILEAKQIFNRKLQVDMAYHSHHMDLVAEEYERALQSIEQPQSSQIKFYSSLYGKPQDTLVLKAGYWVDNLTQPVRFSEAVTKMCKPVDGSKTGVTMLIELGPHSALAGPVKQILKACDKTDIPYSSALVRKRDATEAVIDLAALLFLKGANLDLGAVNLSTKLPELLVDMPRYPWNHNTKYWHEGRVSKRHRSRATPRHDLLGSLANYSTDLEPTWRNILHMDDLLPWLRHYQVQSLNLFPMSAFISIAVQAASQRAVTRNVHHYESFQLRNISVHTPLILSDEDTEMTIQLRPHQEGTLTSHNWDEFRICSWTSSSGCFTEHCKGLIAVKASALQVESASLVAEIANATFSSVDAGSLYDSLSILGVSYGSSFQGLGDCQSNDIYSKATVTAIDTTQDAPHSFQSDYVINPTVLEQLLEMYWPVLGAGRASKSIETVYLPSSIESLNISRRITDLVSKPGDSIQALCKGSLPMSSVVPIHFSITARTLESDEVLLQINDLSVSPILERGVSSEGEDARELCYKLNWEPLVTLEDEVVTNGISNGVTNGVHTNGLTNGVAKSMTNGTLPAVNGIADFPHEDIVIVHGDNSFQKLIASDLADEIEDISGKRPSIRTLNEVDATKKLCLFIVELEQNLLSHLTPAQFSSLQKILTSVEGVLWIVRGAYLSSSNPDVNMVTGLSRSIRSETLLKFATLDLDSEPALCSASTVDTIVTVLKTAFSLKADANCELEFAERKGALYTPRIVNDGEMNDAVHEIVNSSNLELTKFMQEERPLQMAIKVPGALDTLHFVDQSTQGELPSDHIEINIRAIGMNAIDVNAAMGLVSTSSGFGVECSGIVAKVGCAVNTIAVGDRVACFSHDGVYSSATRTKANLAIPIMKAIAFESAAAIPVAYATAYYGLMDLARLLDGERVLIHGANSAIGQAALCLARITGAEVSVKDTSSTENMHKGDFDVVLNCVPTDADTSRDLWSSLSDFGRFVEVKQSDAHHRTGLEAGSLQHNRSFMSVDIMALAVQRPKIMDRLVSQVGDLLAARLLDIPQLSIYSISDVEIALNDLKDGVKEGKLVILPRPEDQVKATLWSKGLKLLRPDVTYVLIGGTGGLGRSMTKWMVSQGARNLVLVSRSGTTTGKVQKLIEDLPEANIVVKSCDVSKEASVNHLIHTELADMPEIKGVVHGAMVLKDVLFEKMTYDQYSSVIESKVQGAWNFHNALVNTKLDFFVAISSAAGAVGNRGQAAYSAANTFLNAFVQYRLKLGLPASSLDLTAVSDAGYLAENAEAALEVSKNLGGDTICEAEVLALFGAAIDGRLAKTCNNHVITGLRITPTTFWTNDAKFKHLRLAAASLATPDSSAPISYKAALKASTSLPEAELVVQKGLLNKLPSVLMLEEEDMDVTRSLSSYALDSLVAIEVRNYITREFEANLQVLELLGSGSIESLAKVICVKSRLVGFEKVDGSGGE